MSDDDPPKKPSGAAFRRARAEREGPANEQDERSRRVLSDDGVPGHQKILERIGRAPLDAVGGVSWANKAAQTLLEEVLGDQVMDLVTKLKWSKDLIAVIGMTHARALVEQRLKEQDIDDDEEDDGEGLEDVPPPAAGPKGPGEGEPVRRPLRRVSARNNR